MRFTKEQLIKEANKLEDILIEKNRERRNNNLNIDEEIDKITSLLKEVYNEILNYEKQ